MTGGILKAPLHETMNRFQAKKAVLNSHHLDPFLVNQPSLDSFPIDSNRCPRNLKPQFQDIVFQSPCPVRFRYQSRIQTCEEVEI